MISIQEFRHNKYKNTIIRSNKWRNTEKKRREIGKNKEKTKMGIWLYAGQHKNFMYTVGSTRMSTEEEKDIGFYHPTEEVSACQRQLL